MLDEINLQEEDENLKKLKLKHKVHSDPSSFKMQRTGSRNMGFCDNMILEMSTD
jgi:hypothetical protein